MSLPVMCSFAVITFDVSLAFGSSCWAATSHISSLNSNITYIVVEQHHHMLWGLAGVQPMPLYAG